MMRVSRVRADTWNALVQQFERLEGCIFRGQCSSSWILENTIERRFPDLNWQHVEYDLLHGFKRRAHNYLGQQHIPDTPGEWLALMQHFGAPTRLLDFTYSPFVAAYFAFEEKPTDGAADCAIWAINPYWCHGHFGRIALLKGVFGKQPDDFTAGVADAKSGPPFDSRTDAEVAGMLASSFIEKNALSNIDEVVSVFEPDRLSERMAAQQGVFLWPGRVTSRVSQNIEALSDASVGVLQIVVPASERGRALDQLRLMNITRASLFPGLDGFASSFRHRFVQESLESRIQRAKARDVGDTARPTPTSAHAAADAANRLGNGLFGPSEAEDKGGK
jgi:hypothetical protein